MSLRVGVSSVSLALALVGSQAWSQPPQPTGGKAQLNPASYQYPYQQPPYYGPQYCPPGYPPMPGQPTPPSAPAGQQPVMPPPRAGQQPSTQPQTPADRQAPAPGQASTLQAPEASSQQAAAGLGQGLTTGAGGFGTDFGGMGDGGASDALASTASTSPGMIGDFVGYTGTRLSVLRSNVSQVLTQRVANGVGGFTTIQVQYNPGDSIFVQVPNAPIASRVAFKVVEDECPAPQDRFFVRFHYFFDVLNDIPVGTDAANFNSIRRIDMYREVIGFEKTLWGDCFSVGLRVPIVQIAQSDNTSSLNLGTAQSFDASDIGDVSVVLKAVIVSEPCSGSLISGGVVFTFPTGPQTSVVRSDLPIIRPISGSFSNGAFFTSDEIVLAQTPKSTATTVVQPWLGFFLDCGCGYVQGFSSAILPIKSDDIKLLANSISLGYYLNDLVTPTVEFHLTTPIEKRGFFGDPIGFPDLFAMTFGSHFHLSECCDLTIGTSIPMTGRAPYVIEGIAELNYRF